MQIPPAIAAIAPDEKLSPRQRRRFLIEMCKRRIRPGTGSASEFLRRRWLSEALARPRLDPAGYPVIDLPYLVLMKMQATRSLDVGDLSRMLGLASEEDLARVRQTVKQYSPQDYEDLKLLIYLGKLELGLV
jgi:hypothetical protein